MKKFLITLALVMQLSPVFADEPLPPDVQRFIDQREGCDHMRGEVPDPSDKKAMKDVARQIRTLCKGTDKILARLKKKYADSPAVTRQLNEFEPDIEAINGRP